MIKAVIIDVDDTLCMTEAACYSLESEVLEIMGCPPMPRDVHLSTWGRPLLDVIPIRSPGIDIDEFMRVYQPCLEKHIAEGKLDTISDSTFDCLDRLVKVNKEIFLLTSRTHNELKHMLEPNHLLSGRIKAFYYSNNTQFHKPDPRVFNELFSENSYSPGECVYVGDLPSDAIAANGAGVKFIACLESGLKSEQEFCLCNVDSFVNKFTDIVSAISKLENFVS